MKTLKRGDSYTNTTNKTVRYKIKYLNCFDMWQTESGEILSGQTFTIFNNSTVILFI